MFDLNAMQAADRQLQEVIERVNHVTRSSKATVTCAMSRIEQSQIRIHRSSYLRRIRAVDPQGQQSK